MTESTMPIRVIAETPAYWRVVFDYPPFNIADAIIFEHLQNLLARIDENSNLRVVVFESATPDFYLAHFDLTGKVGNILTAVGPSGLPILMDTFVRLTKSSVVSIAKIRGCVRGVSSEFVLACDMRFASRENTRLGQPEVAVGSTQAAAVRNACRSWSAAAAHLKSSSAATISMATSPNDMGMSTARSRTRNSTASSTRSHVGSPLSIGVLSRPRRTSSIKCPCQAPITSWAGSPRF
jgi:enoyl-CoA hydratase/carnithine racemase